MQSTQSRPLAVCMATAMAQFHFTPLILSRNRFGPKIILLGPTQGLGYASAAQTYNPLQADFRNGRVEEFLQDQAISAGEMQSGPIAFCVATAMAQFHFSPLILSRNGIAPKPILWGRTKAWAKSVQQHYNADELKALRLHDVLQEVSSWSQPLYFCNMH